jgi:hypothetical protein
VGKVAQFVGYVCHFSKDAQSKTIVHPVHAWVRRHDHIFCHFIHIIEHIFNILFCQAKTALNLKIANIFHASGANFPWDHLIDPIKQSYWRSNCRFSAIFVNKLDLIFFFDQELNTL